MDVFKLRDELVGEYGSYAESFLRVKDERIHAHLQKELRSGLLWPDPPAQLNPAFESGGSIESLVMEGVLDAECERIFRAGKAPGPELSGIPIRLHKHQAEAIEQAGRGNDYVLTTGTGSGKSLAYIIPAVDHALRNGPRNGKVKALIVYPMNALANSQMGELEKFLCHGYPEGDAPVSFARYTGQEDDEARQAIRAVPPDILLTNYVMLEYLLTRPEDRKLIEKTNELRYLVLDELHTYRGRQGADVSLLVRRVRNASGSDQLRVVGTSATLAGAGSRQERRTEVASVASRIFGADVAPESVIDETLRAETSHADLASAEFTEQLARRVADGEPPSDYAEFIEDPLARWIERTLGVIWNEEDERLERCDPIPVGGDHGAAARLATTTEVDLDQCEHAIRATLLAGSAIERADVPFPVFAFRLHQFLSGGATIWASLDNEGDRHVSTSGQQYVPGDRGRVLLPLAFCRECGQEYYSVRQTTTDGGTFVPREISDHSAEENEHDGFLYLSTQDPWPEDLGPLLERVPADWLTLDSNEVAKSQRKHLPKPVNVNLAGKRDPDGQPGVFVQAPFRFCLSCGVTYGHRLRSDFTKLASLGAGGRSTSTTILGLSTLEYLRHSDLDKSRQKVLSFTDNRQDASLQAGHFNDFVQVSLLRSGLYKAALAAGETGLDYNQAPEGALDASGLRSRDYAVNPDLKGNAKNQRDAAMRQVVAYRIYADQTRWRLTSPNLEQAGLIKVSYDDLERCAADEEEFTKDLPTWFGESGKAHGAHPALSQATPETRIRVAMVLLDYMRRELAISADQLNPNSQETLKANSRQYLIDPWSIDDHESLLYASILYPRPRKKETDSRTGRFLSPRGSFGSFLRRKSTFPHLPAPIGLDEAAQVIAGLLGALNAYGLVDVATEPAGDDVPGFQVQAPVIRWIAADGSEAYRDELRTPQGSTAGAQTNEYFVELYKQLASEGGGEMIGREHTAQVDAAVREQREGQFRTGDLPILFCSPTMELGVDIADLNVVNLRNVPPTPANYAQRSGRAGRSGQAALVYTFCSSWNSHDQYFFRRSDRMVSGKVSPPALDLANEDLVRAHINAIWLAETGAKLGSSMTEVLDTDGDTPSLAIRPHISTQLEHAKAREHALSRAGEVLAAIGADLEQADWFDEGWLENTINGAIHSFGAACDRWRDLFRAAQSALDAQNRIIKDASTTPAKRNEAQRLHREASSQLNLLRGVDSSAYQSDFYTYRYFASEGFLPGYNFPRLPLSAFIPARRTKKDSDDFLSRPRFLAITEFGPRSVIYHEGSRYQVNRVILPAGEGEELPMSRIKRCSDCGYLHPIAEGDGPDLCERCRQALPPPTKSLLRLQNVTTRRRDRISSDEEERQRTGYEVRTAVRFDQHSSRSALALSVEGTELAVLEYAGAAQIWRINQGWSRRADPNILGFGLDTKNGYWQKNEQVAEPDPADPVSNAHIKRVIPFVEDHRNSLLFSPRNGIVGNDALATLQAALKRAIQAVFQLEENELAAVPLPDEDDRRLILFYESAEGGAGVLRRLLEPDNLVEVARNALEICHFDPLTGEDKGPDHSPEPCDAGCYDCLLSYSNQRDHRAIDRKLIGTFLVSLATAELETNASPPSAEHLKTLLALCESDLERAFLDRLVAGGYRLPTHAQKLIAEHEARPDFTYTGEHMPVAVFIDGPHHDDEYIAGKDEATRGELEQAGYQVLAFRYDEEWPPILAANAHIFGSADGS